MGPLGDSDLHVVSRQPHTSLHCETTDTGLLHRVAVISGLNKLALVFVLKAKIQVLGLETQVLRLGTQVLGLGTQVLSLRTEVFSVGAQVLSVGTQVLSLETQVLSLGLGLDT